MRKINYLAPKVKTAPIVSSLGFALSGDDNTNENIGGSHINDDGEFA